jgi:ABC-type transport system substrate-binding protein
LTIGLRDGVGWRDGRALDADDVAFTFGFVAQRFDPRFSAELGDVEQVQATDRLERDDRSASALAWL